MTNTRTDPRPAHLLDPTDPALADWLAQAQIPAYRQRQIQKWLFERRAESFSEMTDLPGALRRQLNERFSLWTCQIVQHLQSQDGTEKLLLELSDQSRIEAVLLRDGTRRTICISSQVGCAMGCVFCASGLDGVKRSLSAGEIVEQMLRLQRLLPGDERLTHLVMMGMGEPLANLDNVLPALDVARREDGLGISVRRITVSTVGLPSGIERMAREGSGYQLAVSLHAPNDELRNRLVPVNRAAGLPQILVAADRYFEITKRRLTFEYVLMADVNDQTHHAQQLGRLLRGRSMLLNVIPYNSVAGLPYRTPSRDTQHRFREVLERAGIEVRFRQRKGDKINAACGQLRRSQAADPQQSSAPSEGDRPGQGSAEPEPPAGV